MTSQEAIKQGEELLSLAERKLRAEPYAVAAAGGQVHMVWNRRPTLALRRQSRRTPGLRDLRERETVRLSAPTNNAVMRKAAVLEVVLSRIEYSRSKS